MTDGVKREEDKSISGTDAVRKDFEPAIYELRHGKKNDFCFYHKMALGRAAWKYYLWPAKPV